MKALNHTCIVSAKIARRKSVPAKMLVGESSIKCFLTSAIFNVYCSRRIFSVLLRRANAIKMPDQHKYA